MHRRPVAGSLLYGVRAIAEHLGCRPRQALRLIETGRLPIWREGRTICATRAGVDAWLARREATAAARPIAPGAV